MTGYIEDLYDDLEYDEIFNDWYEIEGVRKIKELSRQLRTFFNYKTEVIRYRFHSSSKITENHTNTKFISQRQRIESLSHEFIIILKRLKERTQSVEEGIKSLFSESTKTQYKKLSEITEKLLLLFHYFSEESIHDYPRLLKFITILAQNIYRVKKGLHPQFREFYEELEINYNDLERELESLLEKSPNVKVEKPIKQLEERLTS